MPTPDTKKILKEAFELCNSVISQNASLGFHIPQGVSMLTGREYIKPLTKEDIQKLNTEDAVDAQDPNSMKQPSMRKMSIVEEDGTGEAWEVSLGFDAEDFESEEDAINAFAGNDEFAVTDNWNTALDYMVDQDVFADAVIEYCKAHGVPDVVANALADAANTVIRSN